MAYAFGGGGSGSTVQEGGVRSAPKSIPAERFEGPPESAAPDSAIDSPHDASALQHAGKLGTLQVVSS